MGDIESAEVAEAPQPKSAPRKKIVIRLARIDDGDDIVALMRIAHEESPRPLPPVDVVYARQWTAQTLGHNLTWVALDGETIVAALMCGIVSHSWNPKPCGIENMHFYVLGPYRRLGVAEALIGKLKATSDKLGLPAKLHIDYGGEGVELKDRFVKRCGLTYVGGNFVFESSAASLACSNQNTKDRATQKYSG